MTTVISVLILLILIAGGWYFWAGRGNPGPVSPGADGGQSGDLITLALGQRGSLNGVTITPREVVEDSRCPRDVQCIQAGRVRVRATLVSGLGTANQIFLVGEPITTEAEAVTLTQVEPDKISTRTINASEYRFTFKVVKQSVTYKNASRDQIEVGTPFPGAVVGKTFKVMGQARGNWYFEASFPVIVLDKDGNRLAAVPAQAQGEWMTTEFVPYIADVSIQGDYIGPATLVLQKDNASGLPEHDASASYPITIEY